MHNLQLRLVDLTEATLGKLAGMVPELGEEQIKPIKPVALSPHSKKVTVEARLVRKNINDKMHDE